MQIETQNVDGNAKVTGRNAGSKAPHTSCELAWLIDQDLMNVLQSTDKVDLLGVRSWAGHHDHQHLRIFRLFCLWNIIL